MGTHQAPVTRHQVDRVRHRHGGGSQPPIPLRACVPRSLHAARAWAPRLLLALRAAGGAPGPVLLRHAQRRPVGGARQHGPDGDHADARPRRGLQLRRPPHRPGRQQRCRTRPSLVACWLQDAQDGHRRGQAGAHARGPLGQRSRCDRAWSPMRRRTGRLGRHPCRPGYGDRTGPFEAGPPHPRLHIEGQTHRGRRTSRHAGGSRVCAQAHRQLVLRQVSTGRSWRPVEHVGALRGDPLGPPAHPPHRQPRAPRR